MKSEVFPLVDDEGNVTGKASRQECHSGSFLLHPVVHLHVLNSEGKLFLQKRSAEKDIQPDKWDTSVGGHVDYGEEISEALFREVREELDIKNFSPVFMHKYKFTSDVEAELVHSYYTIYDGEINIDPVEISEGKFWTLQEINEHLDFNIFTPNFEQEFRHLMKSQLLPIK
jgi:isopentenyldiphosphate isomerase